MNQLWGRFSAVECFRVGQFAEIAGISRQRLDQLHQAGRGPRRTYRIGKDKAGRVRAKVRGVPCIPRGDGLAWIEERRARGLGQGV